MDTLPPSRRSSPTSVVALVAAAALLGGAALFALPSRGHAASDVVAARPAEHVARTISMRGEAVLHVQPDKATMRFGVTAHKNDVSAARDQARERARRVLEALDAAGVEREHISSTGVRVNVINRTASGDLMNATPNFVATQSFTVRLTDLETLDALLEALFDAGITQFQGVTFGVADLRPHRDEARRLAAVAAREKARDLADVFGMTVGLPVSIAEEAVQPAMFRTAMSSANVVAAAVGEVDAGAAGGDVPAGTIEVRAGVHATFELAAE